MFSTFVEFGRFWTCHRRERQARGTRCSRQKCFEGHTCTFIEAFERAVDECSAKSMNRIASIRVGATLESGQSLHRSEGRGLAAVFIAAEIFKVLLPLNGKFLTIFGSGRSFDFNIADRLPFDCDAWGAGIA